ncbi:hypothetical protein ACHAAC_03645 [Aeromicrobium sp. CF4.19]|uniref:hypothetical protein n=1 Tax=Aeromicrobium sp. CF4.19 TaxID=3373082 RepID=UPI003EE600CE
MSDLADRIAASVLAIDGVDGLHGGALGEVATYLPGRRVAGIRSDADGTEVHVVLRWGAPLLPTGDEVRRAVEPLVDGPVHVIIEDVADPRAVNRS